MAKKKQTPTVSRVSDADRARFARLCTEAALSRRSEGDGGFGTLAEKRMHAVIKRYICPNEDFHEVGMADARFIADVRIGNEIFEVQSGSFYPMKKKIAYYLEKTDCTVTVVHPITVDKWITEIDPASGELLSRKKSPKHERASDLLAELYPLIAHLPHERLKFRLLLIEAEEFRLAGARRHRGKWVSARYERMPQALLDVMDFASPDDFRIFLPEVLPAPFTVKDFSRATRIRGRDAYSAVHVLEALGLITQTDPVGRAMAFRRAF
ncbi:MAG: hypothetical protein IJW29_05055 [Clostridia bacterium]|nr:hypothetical protein [Clostridia bacterium]